MYHFPSCWREFHRSACQPTTQSHKHKNAEVQVDKRYAGRNGNFDCGIERSEIPCLILAFETVECMRPSTLKCWEAHWLNSWGNSCTVRSALKRSEFTTYTFHLHPSHQALHIIHLLSSSTSTLSSSLTRTIPHKIRQILRSDFVAQISNVNTAILLRLTGNFGHISTAIAHTGIKLSIHCKRNVLPIFKKVFLVPILWWESLNLSSFCVSSMTTQNETPQ